MNRATLGVGRHSEGVHQLNLMEKVTLEPRREPGSQASHMESVTAQENAGRLTRSSAGIVNSNEISWEDRRGELDGRSCEEQIRLQKEPLEVTSCQQEPEHQAQGRPVKLL